MAAPLAQTASGESWVTVLLTATICLGAGLMLWKFAGDALPEGAVYNFIQWLWIAVVLGQMSHWVMACWKDYKSYEAIPLTLLVLATWAAGKGEKVSERVGSVLFWVLLIMFAAIGVSAVKDIQISNLKPELSVPEGTLLVALLLPCINVFQKGKNGSAWNQGILWVYAVGISAITVGVLSSKVASRVQSPIYELSRSLSLLGIAERFESLVAAAMTLGYFVLNVYLLRTAGTMAEVIKQGCYRKGVVACGILAGLALISGIKVDAILLAAGCGLLWWACPMIRFGLEKIKMKKSKKSA